MQYFNPFLRLGIDPEGFSPETAQLWLKQEKKRLMAEFELQDSSVIDIAGQELDKATILSLFEQLEDPDQLAAHLEVLNHGSLLWFLEESMLEIFYQGDIPLLAAQPLAFRQFIAPYFATQFNKRLFHALRQRDWEEISAMCAHPLPIPQTYHAACYKDSYRYLHGKVQEVAELATSISAGTEPGPAVEAVCDELFLQALNRLPDYFSTVRDKYAIALETLALAVHNSHRRIKLGIFILQQGLKLRLSPETTRRLKHILDQLKEMAPAGGFLENLLGEGEESDRTWTWMMIGGVAASVWLLFKFLR
jgi:hypothetical protein